MGRGIQFVVMMSLLLCSGCFLSYGQVEESAEISLEAHTDEFQEKFFEALKEKAIGNYDRAIALFRECETLEPGLPVIDYQLAKVYMLEREYEAAYEAAMAAYQEQPAQFWYLQTLIEAARARGMTPDQLVAQLGEAGSDVGTKVALAYFRLGAFAEVLEILDKLPRNPVNENLRLRVNDSLKDAAPLPESDATGTGTIAIESRVRQLVLDADYEALGPASEEALEAYPAEPYFYYARGLYLSEDGRYAEAAEILEEGLLYLFEDPELEVAFYKQLASVYTALGEPGKANMYLSKIE